MLSLSNDHAEKLNEADEYEIGVVIITGGLGGLGLVTAETLFEVKAEHVVLVSRSGKVKDYEGQNLQDKLDKLIEKRDVSVSIKCCDMSNENNVSSMLSSTREECGKINTIIHASGLLYDAKLDKLDADSIRSSFGPKASGAWWLHKHSCQDKICNFVVYSSTSLFGNCGQANYSASNSYLDALIRLRRISSLPGLSIQWPAIADVRMAAAMASDFKMSLDEMLKIPQVRNVLKQQLMSSNAQGSIEESIKSPLPRCLLNLDKYPSRLQLFMSSACNTISVENKSSMNLKKTRSKTTSMGKIWTKNAVTKEVENAVRNVIGDNNDEKIDNSLNFMDMGIDSLSIVELSKSLSTKFEIGISSTLLFGKPTIVDLSEHLYNSFFSNNEELSQKYDHDVNDINHASKKIGIFGISVRFPGGVTDLETCWNLISNGQNTSTTTTEFSFILSR